jgi:hypothetical protein
MELQELSIPRSDERARALESYLSRSFEYWNLRSYKDGVSESLVRTKQAVRGCFDHFMKDRT